MDCTESITGAGPLMEYFFFFFVGVCVWGITSLFILWCQCSDESSIETHKER